MKRGKNAQWHQRYRCSQCKNTYMLDNKHYRLTPIERFGMVYEAKLYGISTVQKVYWVSASTLHKYFKNSSDYVLSNKYMDIKPLLKQLYGENFQIESFYAWRSKNRSIGLANYINPFSELKYLY
jgi:hypothetical protein